MIGAWFAPNIEKAWKSFWVQPKVLLRDVGQVETRLDPLEIVLITTQDRCTVCPERTIGMEIILGTHDGTPT